MGKKDKKREDTPNQPVKSETNDNDANLRMEYEQIVKLVGWLNNFWWPIAAVFIPLSLGTIHFINKNSIPTPTWLYVIISVFMICIWLLYILLTKNITFKEKEYLSRLEYIKTELKLNINSKNNSETTKNKQFGNFKKGIAYRIFAYIISTLFIIIWIVILLEKCNVLNF